MDRMISKKYLVLFLLLRRTYVLDICWNCLCEAILTNIQNICCLKFNAFVINCYLLSEGYVTFKIAIITNFVVVPSVGIKRVDCIIRSDGAQVLSLHCHSSNGF